MRCTTHIGSGPSDSEAALGQVRKDSYEALYKQASNTNVKYLRMLIVPKTSTQCHTNGGEVKGRQQDVSEQRKCTQACSRRSHKPTSLDERT